MPPSNEVPMRGRRILAGCGLAAAAAVAGVAALVGFLWLDQGRAVTLPAPTGPFPVGRSIAVWGDEAPDSLAPVPGTRRELLVWIWYPAARADAAAPDGYVPAALLGKTSGLQAPLLFRLLTHDAGKVRDHVLRDAPVARAARPFPVLVMRAGASREVLTYSTLAEDLASHGYVVVGFDAPYRTGVVTFPDGRTFRETPRNNPELVFGAPDSAQRINRILGAWTRDMGFVLDRLERPTPDAPGPSGGRFAGRLDLSRVGAFGHSLGGAEAALFCAEDARCGAGVDIDGAPLGAVVRAGIRRPFMFLLSDHAGTDPATRAIEADIHSVYERLPPDGRLLAEIRGANHFTFSDDGAILKSGLMRGILRAFGQLHISGRRQLAVTAYCLRTFFDAYLKGEGARPPQLASPAYPELRILGASSKGVP
jgi:predicted dienelactone hydrolase